MTSTIPNPEAPNPQLPVVQRLRIRYAKRGRLRFTSHRDFARAFERAVRRARVPIGFSSGFSPHPKISYANAAPTGSASEAEFLEIGLTEPREPAEVQAALDAALPPGLDIVEVVVAGQGSLADRLTSSRWSIAWPELALEDLEPAVASFLAADSVEVERMTKRGLRTIDARGAVVSMACRADDADAGPCAILDVVIRHDASTAGNVLVRPDDVLAGLRTRGGLTVDTTPVATRSAQGPLDPDSGTVGDPFALDRDVSGA